MAAVHDTGAPQNSYAACFQAAVDFGAFVTPQLLKRAGAAMLQRAAATFDNADRKWQVEAGELLAKHHETIRTAYPEALRQEFAALEAGGAPTPKLLSFESLELMGEEQLDETVELLRSQQMVQSQVESELAHLNSLICTAKGKSVVSASANPFRPEAWVRALREATLQCAVPAWVRARWLLHLSEALGPELVGCYRQLCQLLQKQGVAAASFSVSIAPTRTARRAEAAVPDASMNFPAPARPHAGPAQPLLNLHDLRRLLTGDSECSAPHLPERFRPTAPASETVDAALTVPWSFEALQEMRQVDQVMYRMQRRRSADQPGPGAAESFEPPTPAQALSEEVVKLIIENIAADQRLLAPVQQAVRDLEAALLRLAVNDPRFFRDKAHPAREFLTQITERSLAWSSEDMPGFAAFYKPLREAVDVLATLPMDNAEPFEFALNSLEEVWAEEQERGREERAGAARALMKAEERNLLARRIAAQLRERPDVMVAIPQIRRFVTGPWSQVLAAAQMAGSSRAPDPGGYGAIVNDLVWSTQVRLAAENPSRLAKLMPPLLATLRRGLASIEYPERDTKRLIDYLGSLHQAALRPAGAAAHPPTVVAAAMEPRHDESPLPEVWLEPTEARESGLVDLFADVGEPAQPTFDKTRPLPSDAVKPSSGPAVAGVHDALRAGAWADLFIDGAWSRWQLSWSTPHSLLFMFTNGAGKSKSMTRSMLDKMVAIGALRVVSEQSVLASAFEAVAEQALRNTMESAY